MNNRRIYSGCFYCHGYWCKFRKDGTCTATYRLKANWNLPRKFVMRTRDREAVERFIEGLYSNNYEHRQIISDGVAFDLRYEDAPAVGDKPVIIHVSPERLREVFSRECPLGIPEGFGIKYTNGDGGAPITVNQTVAALVSDDLEQRLLADKVAIGKQAIKEGCTFQWVTVGSSVMAEFIPWQEAQLGLSDKETPPEHFILTNTRLENGAQELVYSILRGSLQYFARYTVYEGKTIMLETGADPDGPWQLLQADPTVCAVLGLISAEKAALL